MQPLPLHAFTDFLVIVGVGVALWRLAPMQAHFGARLARIGLTLYALAALAGTVRYGAGLEADLAPLHHGLSWFAATAGTTMLALAVARLAFARAWGPLAELSAYLTPMVVFGVVGLMGDLEPLVPAVGVAALAVGLLSGVVLVRRGDRARGIASLIAWIVLAAASAGIGIEGRDLFGVLPRFHVYHVILALWAAGFSYAILPRLKRAPRPEPARR